MASRRKHQEGGHQNNERWLLTYADLITLLMVLFVVMYATSQSDIARFAEVAASLQKAFRVPVLEGLDPTAVQGRNGPPTVAPPTPPPPSQKPSRTPSQIELFRSSLYQALRTDVETYVEAHGLKDRFWVGLRRDGVAVTISGELLFEAGRADLLSGGQELLWVASARLVGLPNEVRVAGHTDDVILDTPQFPSNWELSSARALSVLRFLRDQAHIPPARLVAMGYGQYRPIAGNETREGRARNRRVEVLIVDSEPRLQEERAS